MPRVVHLLPHRGGGAETYIQLLEALPGYGHERVAMSPTRSRWRGAPQVALSWPAIARHARRADVIHVHGDTAAILARPMLRDRPSVITTHGLHRLRAATGASSRVVEAGVRGAVRAAGATICTSDSEREGLVALLPPEDAARVVFVPNGVPVPVELDPVLRARRRAELGVPDKDVVALFVGQLEDRKEPLAAVAAVERAADRGVPIVLWVAGEGPLADAVAARSSDAVRPLGFRSDAEQLYGAADLFVLPSRREGMSIALLEAMAAGMAAVVSDAPGNAEAVGDAGRIVPLGEVEALADSLTELALDPRERARLGSAGRERVRHHFSPERFLAETREVYERVLSRRDP